MRDCNATFPQASRRQDLIGGGAISVSTGAPGSAPTAADATTREKAEAARGYSEQQRRRLLKLYDSKSDEARALGRSLQEARDATEAEMRLRLQSERQAHESLRRLAELQAALDQERRHNTAITQERERLVEKVRSWRDDDGIQDDHDAVAWW